MEELILNEQITQLQEEIEDLKSENKRLTDENDILRQQIVKLGALGDEEKERLLNKIIEQHPDCYDQIEFDEAFKEAIDKHK